MRQFACMIVALMAFSWPAIAAEPWVSTGQTTIQGIMDNPASNLVGLIGEVDLPYQVPAGKTLVLGSYGLEGHDSATMPDPLFVAFVWISDQPMPFATGEERAPRALLSCLTRVGTIVCPVEYHVPAGKWVNLSLIGPPENPFLLGWIITGELL